MTNEPLLTLMLEHLDDARQGKQHVFRLSSGQSVLIGRDETAEICFGRQEDDIVSRLHARITFSGNAHSQAVVMDLGSRNGTFINLARVDSHHILRSGDIIRLGTSGPELRVRILGQDKAKARSAGFLRGLRAWFRGLPGAVSGNDHF